jgi:hypothetical protein
MEIIGIYFIFRCTLTLIKLLELMFIFKFIKNYLDKKEGALDSQIMITLKGKFPNSTEDDLERILLKLPEHFKRKNGFILNLRRVKDD